MVVSYGLPPNPDTICYPCLKWGKAQLPYWMLCGFPVPWTEPYDPDIAHREWKVATLDINRRLGLSSAYLGVGV